MIVQKPLVSVWMTTYNHEKYIAQAIDSVLMQKTDFPFELLIGEDCSTDNTGDICKYYAEKHPHIIRLFSRAKNLGMMENGIQTVHEAKGKYIAVCEGDDYWTDPLKLQSQVDFLENHQECSLCFHALENVYEDESKNYVQTASNKSTFFTVKDVIVKGGGFIATGSMFFRREYLEYLPNWFKTAPIGDYPLAIILAKFGKVGYINKVMSVYRRAAEGAWSSGELTFEKIKKVNSTIRNLLFTINRWTKYKYIIPIVQKIWIDYFYLIRAFVYFKLKKNKTGNLILSNTKRLIKPS